MSDRSQAATGSSPAASSTVDEFRRSFDEGFALPQRELTSGLEDLLAIRVGGDPYALRVSELAGLHRSRQVVTLPAHVPDLLGLAGIRGKLVPVFSLAVLLGYETARDQGAWLALCRGDQDLALSFGDFAGHLRVTPDQICAAEGPARAHLRQVVRIDSTVRTLVSVPSIVTMIEGRMDGVAHLGGAKS
jgi:chemotaxis signal transduction protein